MILLFLAIQSLVLFHTRALGLDAVWAPSNPYLWRKHGSWAQHAHSFRVGPWDSTVRGSWSVIWGVGLVAAVGIRTHVPVFYWTFTGQSSQQMVCLRMPSRREWHLAPISRKMLLIPFVQASQERRRGVCQRMCSFVLEPAYSPS